MLLEKNKYTREYLYDNFLFKIVIKIWYIKFDAFSRWNDSFIFPSKEDVQVLMFKLD